MGRYGCSSPVTKVLHGYDKLAIGYGNKTNTEKGTCQIKSKFKVAVV